ncbi:MAG: hypothetical protein AAF705_15715, partial [Bacteroidota bacterium]
MPKKSVIVSRLGIFILLLTAIICQGQDVYLLNTAYPVHDLENHLKIVEDTADQINLDRLLSDTNITFSSRADFPRYLDQRSTYWGKIDLIVKGELEGWTLQ